MNVRFSGRAVIAAAVLLFILVIVFMKKGERIKGVAFFIGWLVPGAGHVVLGQWKKGLFFFLILGVTYLFGMWVAGFRPVSFDDNPFYYVGQYGSGVTMLIAKLRGAEKAVVGPALHPSWFDPGLLYVCVVGLLNLVVMLSVLDARTLSAETPVASAALAPAPAVLPPAGDPAPAVATGPAPETPS